MILSGLFARVASLLSGRQTLSPEGLDALKAEEGFVPRVYLDGEEPGVPIDKRTTGQPTIGYGHLLAPEEVARYAGGITRDEAHVLLLQDVADAERLVREVVTVPLTQGQFDALVSLAFNIGLPRFRGSTLVQLLNAGDYAGAAGQFGVWRLAGGKVDGRLVARRARERAMFEREA